MNSIHKEELADDNDVGHTKVYNIKLKINGVSKKIKWNIKEETNNR